MLGLVSVIIPTYNREKFLPYALESVKNQTYKNWELIIVDDGSSDNTEKVCKQFARTVKQSVKYIYHDNRGVAGARNTGLRAAKGDFIAFLDSDDRWYPWHLKRCVSILNSVPQMDFIFAGGRKFDFSTGKILVKHNFFIDKPHPLLSISAQKVGNFVYYLVNTPGLRKLVLDLGIPSGLQCMVFRKKSITNFFFPEFLKVAEDRFFVFGLILKGRSFGYSLTVHTMRFVHKGHLSAENLENWKKAEFIAYNLIKCYRSLKNLASKNEQKILNKKIAHFYADYLCVALLKQGNKFSAFRAAIMAIRYNPFVLAYYKRLLSVIVS